METEVKCSKHTHIGHPIILDNVQHQIMLKIDFCLRTHSGVELGPGFRFKILSEGVDLSGLKGEEKHLPNLRCCTFQYHPTAAS